MKIFIGGLLCLALFLAAGCNPNLQRSNPLDPQYEGGGSAYSVSGKIDSINGNPIQGARVSVAVGTGGAVLTTQTDNFGDYFFSSVPSGAITLDVGADWHNGHTEQMQLTGNVNRAYTLYNKETLWEDWTGFPGGTVPYGKWGTTLNGAGSPDVRIDFITPPISQTTNYCKLYSGVAGATAGDYARLFLNAPLESNRGVKMTFRMGVSEVNGFDIRMILSTGTVSDPKIEFGMVDMGANWIGLNTPVLGGTEYSAPSQSISATTFYDCEMIADRDSNNVSFKVKNSGNQILFVTKTLFGGAGMDLRNIFFQSTVITPASGKIGYVDDIRVILK